MLNFPSVLVGSSSKISTGMMGNYSVICFTVHLLWFGICSNYMQFNLTTVFFSLSLSLAAGIEHYVTSEPPQYFITFGLWYTQEGSSYCSELPKLSHSAIWWVPIIYINSEHPFVSKSQIKRKNVCRPHDR